jgi:hypothetical protein
VEQKHVQLVENSGTIENELRRYIEMRETMDFSKFYSNKNAISLRPLAGSPDSESPALAFVLVLKLRGNVMTRLRAGNKLNQFFPSSNASLAKPPTILAQEPGIFRRSPTRPSNRYRQRQRQRNSR